MKNMAKKYQSSNKSRSQKNHREEGERTQRVVTLSVAVVRNIWAFRLYIHISSWYMTRWSLKGLSRVRLWGREGGVVHVKYSSRIMQSWSLKKKRNKRVLSRTLHQKSFRMKTEPLPVSIFLRKRAVQARNLPLSTGTQITERIISIRWSHRFIWL